MVSSSTAILVKSPENCVTAVSGDCRTFAVEIGQLRRCIPEQSSPTRSLSSIKQEHLFEGIVEGQITRERSGVGGFGYDPIFRPDGYDQTFAELGATVKNQISHRARATQKLCQFLLKN